MNPVYYAPDSAEASPSYPPHVGDDRRAPWLLAELAIDDQGTPAPADDVVSGRFIVGPTARNLVTRIESGTGRPLRVVESWRSYINRIVPTTVHSATANDVGGFDYVIGRHGFPARLCRQRNPSDCFPSAEASLIRAAGQAENTWTATKSATITRGQFLGANPGLTTQGEFVGYRCADNADGVECRTSPMAWNARQQPGFDNIVLKLSTNESGYIIRAEGYWTHEFILEGGPARLASPPGEPNSWLGGYLDFRPVAADPRRAANDSRGAN